MRLIDADKIDFNEVFIGASEFSKNLIGTAQSLIDRQPTVEAKEVVHGEWIEYGEDAKGNSPIECPRCRYLYARLYPKNFCPNCGCDMRTSAE